MASDLDIARASRLRPIGEIAAAAGIPAEALIPYGRYKGKVDGGFIRSLEDRPDGRPPDAVGVGLALGVAAGMELRGGLLGRQDGDIPGEEAV